MTGKERIAEEMRKAQEIRCCKVLEALTAIGFADDYTPLLYEYMRRMAEMMEVENDARGKI